MICRIHCVDSWCLAYHTIGGEPIVDNTDIFCIPPIPIQRRNLHREVPKKGGVRSRYGSTRFLGTRKNMLVKHIKHGLSVICGHQKGGLSLRFPIEGGKRLTLSVKLEDCKILTRLNFRYKSIVSE